MDTDLSDDDYVRYYLQRLRGKDTENAYHSLLELPDSRVPELIKAFYAETDTDVKAELVEIVWQHRLESTLPFLKDALESPHEKIWRKALDGLVTLASPTSLEILNSEKQWLLSNNTRVSNYKLEWVDEAIQQIQDILEQSDF